MMDTHKKKYSKWKNLCPPETRYLCEKIEQEIVPFFLGIGFQWISVSYHDPEWVVSGSEIDLERINEDSVDTLSIAFEKYRSPRFQICLIKRKKIQGNEFLRSASLVKKSSEYYRMWGKPWFWPTKYWPNSLTDKTIQTVKAGLEPLVEYIDKEKRSEFISRQLD
ncbi:hypothetical protein [Cellvibrio sp. UBA7671]|uniref:hypothetical protein n=1 Tax=Cellvibrio sp. UBA7671 TaxID=1946312 RepID=UPI002F357B77